MSEKTIKSRIVHKHDTEANWLKATNFIPKQGEIIIYDIDDTHNYERMKIGDGKTVVSSLPFVEASKAETANHATNADHATKADSATTADKATKADSATEADTLDGKHASDFALATDLDALEGLVGDTSVANQISEAIANIDTEVSWNDLTDKPFGEPVYSNVLIWDCDTTGKESPDGMMYFVCDAEVTYEELKKCAIVECYNEGVQFFTFDMAVQINDADVLITEAFAYAKFDGAKLGNVTYPKRGFYCYPNGDEFRIILDESVKVFKTDEVTSINTKYLPEHLQFGESVHETAIFTEQEITALDGLNYCYIGESVVDRNTEYSDLQIKIDGINYPLVFRTHVNGNSYFGNASIANPSLEDTGESFCVTREYSGGSNSTLVFIAGTNWSHNIGIVDIVTEVEKLDPKYLPNNGITNWNDLEGKPFDISIIADQQIFEGTEFGPVMVTTPIIEGQTYIITYNGTEYKCIARNYDGYLMLGNNAIYEYDGDINIDTGEPFAIEWYGEEPEGSGYSNKDIQHTIQIKSIRTLDLQYLPEHSHSWNDLVGRPFGEDMLVRDYLYNGEMMFETDEYSSGSGYLGVGEIFCSDRNKYSYDDKLFVVIDSEEYLLNDLLGLSYGVHSNGAYGVGNSALVQSNGADTGENYYIHWTGTSNIFMLHIYHRNAGTHNIEVYVEYSGIKTIDPKYLPVDDIIVAEADHAVSADTATKATQDADGNVIIDTYATKTELSEATKALTIEDIDAICGVDDVTALVNAEFLFEATDSEGNTLTDNVDNTYVF